MDLRSENISPMSPDIAEAIRSEHNEVVQAVQRAQARAVNVGELLLEIRSTMEPFAWIQWLDTKCPIPKSAAHRLSLVKTGPLVRSGT